MYFQKIIVCKIPPGVGRGVYSQLKAYKIMYLLAGTLVQSLAKWQLQDRNYLVLV